MRACARARVWEWGCGGVDGGSVVLVVVVVVVTVVVVVV